MLTVHAECYIQDLNFQITQVEVLVCLRRRYKYKKIIILMHHVQIIFKFTNNYTLRLGAIA